MEIFFESIGRFVPHKILGGKKNSGSGMLRLIFNIRRSYNRKKLGEHFQAGLKRHTRQLLAEKKNTQEAYLWAVLQNEGKCWTDFYKYVKRRKGNRENISVVKDCNGSHITDSTEKVNSLNSYYASVFGCE